MTASTESISGLEFDDALEAESTPPFGGGRDRRQAVIAQLVSLLDLGGRAEADGDRERDVAGRLVRDLRALASGDPPRIAVRIVDGEATLNASPMHLDAGGYRRALDLETRLQRWGAGGLDFGVDIEADELVRFFGALTAAAASGPEAMGTLTRVAREAGVWNARLTPRRDVPAGCDEREVEAVWTYAASVAGARALYSDWPVDEALATRHACAIARMVDRAPDLGVGLTTLGRRRGGAPRRAVDVAVLLAAVGGALGLERRTRAGLARVGLLHEVGRGAGNPDRSRFRDAEAAALISVQRLAEADAIDGDLAREVAVAIEHAIGARGIGPPHLALAPPPLPISQLVAVARAWLAGQVAVDDRPPASALESMVGLLRAPPGQAERSIVQAFACAIGFWTIGTVVDLHNGDVGVVVRVARDPGETLPLLRKQHVTIRRVRDAAGEPIDIDAAPVVLDGPGPDGRPWTAWRARPMAAVSDPELSRAVLDDPDALAAWLASLA